MIQPEARPQPYDRHVGRYGPRLAAELISATGIARGQRALDVGCGLGALTIELARVLGERSVATIDPTESAAETCRVRVSEAEVIVAPMENRESDGPVRCTCASIPCDARRCVRGHTSCWSAARPLPSDARAWYVRGVA